MKLELDSKEVEAVLLEYAQAKWPGQFNHVESSQTYEPMRGVMFTHENKPDKKE